MIIQSVNRSDTERVWVAIENTDAATLTTHYPVFKYNMAANTASVSTNQGGLAANAAEVDGYEGSMIGLMYEDLASGSVGLVQTYGYHESCLIMQIVGSVTVTPGNAIGPGAADASTGLSSSGAVFGIFGPVVNLDTITATQHSLGGATGYADHVFLRCM